MKEFTYFTPTKVVFGIGVSERTGALLKEAGASKVLLHYGGGSAERSGLLTKVRSHLQQAGIGFVELGGVKPNPRVSLIREGIALARKEKVDFILAVGGGSVIDSAKAIGYGIPYDGDVWDFYNFKAVAKTATPVAALLTLAAAGSEMSDSSVITNEEGWIKRGTNNNVCRCKLAIMDPQLTLSVSDYQTACGSVDILMHTLERYFSAEKTLDLTDAIAEGLMRTVINNALKLKENSQDISARAEIMWASSLSHNGLTGCGSGVGDWACHKLEHELSGLYDVAHGAGLAAIWSGWARYVYDTNPARFAQLANRVFNIEGEDETSLALAGICAMEDFFSEIDMPACLNELKDDISDDEILLMAKKCVGSSPTGKVGGFRVLEEPDMIEVYKIARTRLKK
ncbi:MAG: iron-containing alcohol dehydrogenase [Erysipelotrichaceae bacterium]|jgi:alcohol dehydrogenase YqhD (iron-dependent ADH family)|nr:iron-containing alcohol dehydrogenase [Erysipelotrichaceae bacterium]